MDLAKIRNMQYIIHRKIPVLFRSCRLFPVFRPGPLLLFCPGCILRPGLLRSVCMNRTLLSGRLRSFCPNCILCPCFRIHRWCLFCGLQRRIPGAAACQHKENAQCQHCSCHTPPSFFSLLLTPQILLFLFSKPILPVFPWEETHIPHRKSGQTIPGPSVPDWY